MAQDAIDNRRAAKGRGEIFVPPEAKLLFVVRIRGTIGVGPKVKKILRLFRLRALHMATFVKVNAATINMLRLIEPYVAYGYPNLKSVREIIYKRGYGKLSGQRVPLSANSVVQAGLGDKGIVCVEDLIHEIYTVGPNFKEASSFLWPFKFPSPKGGFRKTKNIHFNEGGQAGQQEHEINRFIKKLL
jgi:large subunit ribosomal protein L7e